MEAALQIFPTLSVRNTFLHCDLPGSLACLESRRRFSCPPRERLASPRAASPADKKGCSSAGAATSSASSSAPASRGCGREGSRGPTEAGPHPSASSVPPSPYSPSQAKGARAAVARGPPPYAPPVGLRKRQAIDSAIVADSPAAARDSALLADGAVAEDEKGSSVVVEAKSEESEKTDEWVDVVRKKKQTKRVDSSITVQEQEPLHRQVEVGIDDDPEFCVVKRLLGAGGENVQRIRDCFDINRVELRGAGTKPDSTGPLVLHIKGDDAAQCAKAFTQASELVAGIRRDYEAFVARRLTEVAAGDGREPGSVKDVVDSQEDSTSADGSVHALNDGTDSDALDPAASSSERGGVEEDPQSGWKCIDHRGKASASQERSADFPTPSWPTKSSPSAAEGASPFAGRFSRSSAAGIGQFIHHEVLVGMEHTPDFPVVRKLIGPGGTHMKKISNACPGTKVELRGEGTNPWLGESGPLVLHIRGRDPAQCAAAVRLAKELVEGVRKEHQSS